jgi:hypothetical protein
MVDTSNLANMFSQQTGAQPSLANSIMTAVIGFMMQKGIGSMFSSGGSNSGGIMSAMSNILGTSGGGTSNNLSQDHELVQHVQQTCGIQDPQQAAHYTQQAVNVMNQHGNSNPQGLQSLFSNFMGGGTGTETSTQSPSQQQVNQQNQNKKKGLLGDVMSGLGI